jgi:hypothetical protein
MGAVWVAKPRRVAERNPKLETGGGRRRNPPRDGDLLRASPDFPGRLKGAVSYVLVLALIVASLPARVEAEWQDKSGSLPGTISGKETATIIAGGAAVAGLVVYLVVKKKRNRSKSKATASSAKASPV